jgi:hypothetical protein
MKKPFRRIIALLLAACCLYSFSGCASVKDIISTLIKIKEKYGSEETTTFETDLPETLAEADTTASETVNPINAEEEPAADSSVTFREYIVPAVFALSFTNYSVDEYKALSDPNTLWEALGWYTGYLYMSDGTTELSKETIAVLTKLFCGSDEFIDCPADFIDGEYIEKRVATYSFPGFCYMMEDYFGDEGTMQFAVETDGFAVYSHILEIIDGEGIYTTDYEWYFEESGGNPPYALTDYALPSLGEDYYDGEYYLVSADELEEYIDINNMQHVCLADGNRVFIDYSATYDDMPEGEGIYQQSYYERRDGWLAVSFLSSDSVSGEYWGGYYRGFNYWHDFESGRMICTIEAATEAPEWQYDNVINFHLIDPIELGLDVWGIYTDYGTIELSYVIEYADTEYTYYVITEIDAESKLIQFVKTYSVFSPGTDSESHSYTEYTCYYNDELDDEFVSYYTQNFDEMEHNTRTVTVNYPSIDENYNAAYEVPKTWELIPAGYSYEQLYLNKGLTKSYEYPGDNINYEIWASMAVG